MTRPSSGVSPIDVSTGHAVADRRGGGAVAEVQRRPGAARRGHGRGTAAASRRDVLVADAVHAVAPDACLPVDLAGPARTSRRRPAGRRTTPCRRRPPAAARERLPGQPDPGQRRRVVQRGELGELVHARAATSSSRSVGLVNAAAAVDDPVAHRVQVVRPRPRAPPRRPRSKAASCPVSSSRSTVPRTLDRPLPGSTTRYFSDDDPALRTRTWATGRVCLRSTSIEPRTRRASGADGSCGSEDYRSTG